MSGKEGRKCHPSTHPPKCTRPAPPVVFSATCFCLVELQMMCRQLPSAIATTTTEKQQQEKSVSLSEFPLPSSINFFNYIKIFCRKIILVFLGALAVLTNIQIPLTPLPPHWPFMKNSQDCCCVVQLFGGEILFSKTSPPAPILCLFPLAFAHNWTRENNKMCQQGINIKNWQY